MKKHFVFLLGLIFCLSLISCDQNKKTETNQKSSIQKIESEINEKPDVLNATKEEMIKIEEESASKKATPISEKEQVTDRIIYEMVELEDARLNDWSRKIIAIIDKDTLNVPWPHPKKPSDLIYSDKGDLNGNGYNDILISSGSHGTCCDPNYTIASYDGEKFRLSQTIEWVEDYEISTLEEGYSLFSVKRTSDTGGKDNQFNETSTYEYSMYDLKKITHKESLYIQADVELTTADLYDKDFPERMEMHGKEYIYMPYGKNKKENLKIICSPIGSRSLLGVYLYNEETSSTLQIISFVGRVGVLPIDHEGYPLLVVNMDEIYTRDGPYKGDVEEVYKQLRNMGRM